MKLTKSIFHVLELCLVMSLLVLGSLEAAYVPRAGYQAESGAPTHEDIENSEVNFEGKDLLHSRTVQVSDGGNIVQTIVGDFEVTIDEREELALIKDTTSMECYFTRIENVPELKAGSDQFRHPMVSKEEPQGPVSGEFALLKVTGLIPAGFVETVTGPIMRSQCLNLPSYWLGISGADQSLVQRRRRRDNNQTLSEGNTTRADSDRKLMKALKDAIRKRKLENAKKWKPN